MFAEIFGICSFFPYKKYLIFGSHNLSVCLAWFILSLIVSFSTFAMLIFLS